MRRFFPTLLMAVAAILAVIIMALIPVKHSGEIVKKAVVIKTVIITEEGEEFICNVRDGVAKFDTHGFESQILWDIVNY